MGKVQHSLMEKYSFRRTFNYGDTTLNINETILTLISESATATGSAFGVNQGVYFIRGTFVDVSTSLMF